MMSLWLVLPQRNYLRMRGEYVPAQERSRQWLGTTSACAENTFVHLAQAVYGGNYLRMRGEYIQLQHIAAG